MSSCETEEMCIETGPPAAQRWCPAALLAGHQVLDGSRCMPIRGVSRDAVSGTVIVSGKLSVAHTASFHRVTYTRSTRIRLSACPEGSGHDPCDVLLGEEFAQRFRSSDRAHELL